MATSNGLSTSCAGLLATILCVLLMTCKTVDSSDSLNCSSERFNTTDRLNATIHRQEELDVFVENITSFSNSSVDRCVQLFLKGKSYKLDVIKVMKIHLGPGGGLAILGVTYPRVRIDCYASVTDLEQLRNILRPLSNVSLVVLEGLTFIGCPVPLMLEEVSTVIVKNCDFM